MYERGGDLVFLFVSEATLLAMLRFLELNRLWEGDRFFSKDDNLHACFDRKLQVKLVCVQALRLSKVLLENSLRPLSLPLPVVP